MVKEKISNTWNQRTMTYHIETKILFLLLSIYTASLIIFDLSQNVIISNLFNILLFTVFGIFFLMNKNLKLQINNLIIMYFFFTAFSLGTIFWAVNFNLAFTYSMRLIVAVLNLFIIYTIISHYKIHNAILYGATIGAFFNYLLAFNLIHVHYDLYEFGRFLGSQGNSNKLSRVMLIAIFSSLILLTYQSTNKYLKIYLKFSILLSLYLIFLTVSKKAIILAPILLVSSLSFQRIKLKNIIITLIVFIILIKLFFTYADFTYLDHMRDILDKRFEGLFNLLEGKQGDASSGERAYLLEEGFKIFLDNPIIGTGLNNFRVFLGKYAHNNYLELLVDTGIIGMLLFYSIYIIILKKIKNMQKSKLRKYLLIMILILLLMDLATVTYYNKLILLVLLYIFYIAKNNQKENQYA